MDRLVHHATILEMNGDSYRRRAAASRQSAEVDARASTSSDNHADNVVSDNIKEEMSE